MDWEGWYEARMIFSSFRADLCLPMDLICPKKRQYPAVINVMKKQFYLSLGLTLALAPDTGFGQAFDVSTFDSTVAGPWSELAKTTLMVPKVANGSVKQDGAVSAAEYGGFTGVTVTPGVNAWLLDWPEDRSWDNAADSSFTYWLAHDDDYFYVGVNAKDDIVNSDDPNGAFWKDDSIEIVVDALLDRFDNNTDSSNDAVGGHCYVNFQGRFSGWDDTAKAKAGMTWASAVPWTYADTGDIFGSGKSATGGWQMEVRFKKRVFEDATAKNKLKNGYVMGFNIGMDDDDKKGQGLNGDKSRTQDLELQYFWANRQRFKGVNKDYLDGLTPDDRAAQIWRADTDNYPLTIDSAGRLSHAGTGEIIFGFDENMRSSGKVLFVTSNGASPGNADAALIALLQAKGYTVTVYQSGGAGDDMRAAAAANDVVLISETIGSGTVLEPVGDPAVSKFMLRDSNVPVISFEAFMWDNAEWVSHPEDFSNEFSFFGNTGRTEDSQPENIKNGRDSLHIRSAAHPIAKGMSGKVKVFTTPYSLNYGKPSADADIIASVEPDGTFPTLFVYEKGDKLVDGSVVPNKRIGFYLGQVASLVANWNPEIRYLTEEGKALLFSTLDYAIGVKAPPTLSLARSGNDLTITYGGGTLQSAGSVTGTWNNESGASPLKVTPSASAKFYRVRSN